MSDGKVSDFAAAKAKLEAKGPNQEAIDAARETLARCESGQLRGFVLFGTTNGQLAVAQAGDGNFGDIIAAFEDWKFKILSGRRGG